MSIDEMRVRWYNHSDSLFLANQYNKGLVTEQNQVNNTLIRSHIREHSTLLWHVKQQQQAALWMDVVDLIICFLINVICCGFLSPPVAEFVIDLCCLYMNTFNCGMFQSDILCVAPYFLLWLVFEMWHWHYIIRYKISIFFKNLPNDKPNTV